MTEPEKLAKPRWRLWMITRWCGWDCSSCWWMALLTADTLSGEAVGEYEAGREDYKWIAQTNGNTLGLKFHSTKRGLMIIFH